MKKLLVVVRCAFFCVAASAWGQVKYQQLTSPIQSWESFALSKDGKVMAANIGGEIFRWTAAGGFIDLGLGDTFNSSIGISADGNTIVGRQYDRGRPHGLRRQLESGDVATGCGLGGSRASRRRLRP